MKKVQEQDEEKQARLFEVSLSLEYLKLFRKKKK